jgi:hypothetical protein
MLLHFSLVISRLVEQNKILAQRVGLLSERVEQLERGWDVAAGEPDEAGSRAPVTSLR